MFRVSAFLILSVSLLTVSFISYPVFVQSEKLESSNNDKRYDVPTWIKTNAEWWANGEISDFDFILGINHLIEEKVIIVPHIDQTNTNPQDIPPWIKNTAGWWAEGSVDDESFIHAIQFLIKAGIISPKID